MELTGKCKEEFEKWYLQWVFNEKTFLIVITRISIILNNSLDYINRNIKTYIPF